MFNQQVCTDRDNTSAGNQQNQLHPQLAVYFTNLEKLGAEEQEANSDYSHNSSKPYRNGSAKEVTAKSNQQSHDTNENDASPRHTGGFFFLFLICCSIGILQTITDGQQHVANENCQHDKTHPAGEEAQHVGSKAVQCCGHEEENGGGTHGLYIDRAGIAGDGNRCNQSSVADDRTDCVTVSHSTGASQCAGCGNHNLGQSGTDGNNGGTDNDIG